MLPFLVRIEAEVFKIDKVKKADEAQKPKKVQKSKKATKAKKFKTVKRKTQPQQAVARKLPTNNFSELKKLLPGLGAAVDTDGLESFSPTPEWKNFIRKWAPSLVTAILVDTKIIKTGEEKQCLRYVKDQVKPVT